MSWTLNGKPVTCFEDFNEPKALGFVYLITNTTNGRKYIGKKLLTFASTKQVKGKKKRIRVASDWMIYYGSSDEVKADVALFGEESFTREILHVCLTKGETNYLELREQMDRRVLETNEYYNGQVQARIHKGHLGRLKPPAPAAVDQSSLDPK